MGWNYTYQQVTSMAVTIFQACHLHNPIIVHSTMIKQAARNMFTKKHSSVFLSKAAMFVNQNISRFLWSTRWGPILPQKNHKTMEIYIDIDTTNPTSVSSSLKVLKSAPLASRLACVAEMTFNVPLRVMMTLPKTNRSPPKIGDLAKGNESSNHP